MNRFEPIWTTDDFRRTVTDLRALAEPECSRHGAWCKGFGGVLPCGKQLATVIDIRTRERLA